MIIQRADWTVRGTVCWTLTAMVFVIPTKSTGARIQQPATTRVLQAMTTDLAPSRNPVKTATATACLTPIPMAFAMNSRWWDVWMGPRAITMV